MYYLQSRYYNPVVGRFVNSDSVEWIGANGKIIETNIFSYCKNDCINRTDEIGYGGIDTLLEFLNSCIDAISKIVDMIGNTYNKEKKQLESSVKLLTRKQSKSLTNIKNLQNETSKISKRLGWIGYGITFLTIIIGLATSFATGGNVDHTIIELTIECFIAFVEFGAGKLFEWIAKFIPYVGFLIGLIAGWLISYLLGEYFNADRAKRIKAQFTTLVRNTRISVVNWLKSAVKSLTA